MHEKIAFVAMKFFGDSWSDKRYKVIREVLEEAGYESIRADEIKTSGVGTEEVCKYLESAELSRWVGKFITMSLRVERSETKQSQAL